MSSYEKIATILLVILIIPMMIFSYREISEPKEGGATPAVVPRFDQSIGQNFKIGPYSSIVGQNSSGGPEDNCEQLQTVIIGALHDIKERLEHQKVYTGVEDVFEVNNSTLQLFCNRNASIILTDAAGNKLMLTKMPFVRAVPPGSGPSDIGTSVHIDATVTPAGAATPAQPTTYGEVLIPDRFLDSAVPAH